MRPIRIAFVFLFILVPQLVAEEVLELAPLLTKARLHDSRISPLFFEKSPEAVRESAAAVRALWAERGDRIAAAAEAPTFGNTIGALDLLGHEIGQEVGRLYFLKEVSPDAAVRTAATEVVQELQAFEVEFAYREDIFEAVKAYAAPQPELIGEEKKLFEETLRDYERLGMHLPEEERAEIEALKKELAAKKTQFSDNIRNAGATLEFTAEELAGVPDDTLGQLRAEEGRGYRVQAHVTWQYLAVMQQAESEATRKRLFLARYTLAREANIPLLQEIVALRADIAGRLGYASWANYRTEERMAGSGARVAEFLDEVTGGLQPKFEAETAEMKAMKAADLGVPVEEVDFSIWDWRYHKEKLKEEKYAVDTSDLKYFFELERTLEGMYQVYERIFGLEISRVNNPDPWAEGVFLLAISDAQTGAPLGLCYMDLFPREGKYNHFAQFGILEAIELPGGISQRPTVAIVGNFVPAPEGEPTLLPFNQVETLFHEFGHALHSTLTTARFARHAGTNVPRDFVEAPSQVLEYWLEDPQVLALFAEDVREPGRTIPAEKLERIRAAETATRGGWYRRQLTFGKLDLLLHSAGSPGEVPDVRTATNSVFGEVFFPVPEDTAFVAYFGHLMGYDSSYYGYAWSDVLAADMASVFARAEDGFLNEELGMRLRREVFEPGDSRPVEESVRAFLGREPSPEAFYRKLGLAE